MPLISNVVYQGNLRTLSRHLTSANELITDAPLDNNGRGQAFSPTDLVATSLANCMLTIMGIRAANLGINIDGAKADIEKIMGSDPRRIAEIKVDLTMPQNTYSDRDKTVLERAARTCPVALSLHPDTIQTIRFNW